MEEDEDKIKVSIRRGGGGGGGGGGWEMSNCLKVGETEAMVENKRQCLTKCKEMKLKICKWIDKKVVS